MVSFKQFEERKKKIVSFFILSFEYWGPAQKKHHTIREVKIMIWKKGLD